MPHRRESSAEPTWRNKAVFRTTNQHRCLTAAAKQSERAQEALRILAERDLSGTPVWRKRWRDVLESRAGDPESSLAELAAAISPPMTKSAYSCQLDRAIRFAQKVADTANSESDDSEASPLVGTASYDSKPAPAMSSLGGDVGAARTPELTVHRGIPMNTAPRHDTGFRPVERSEVRHGIA
ncbi:helix-turn-helix domain-containing protein [Mycobacterium sp. 1245111.1]|uniref:helix-turn-helix domain-containing protein n=1 Tax=Mycobacterium sp. 1245111.1 TaxID=1834073 RepID=UPI000B2DFA77|nr:helix-turn-helix domain-containing protein [Mycobacterium sp. 1245111.1]